MACFIPNWECRSHNLPTNKFRNLLGALPIFTSLPLRGEKCPHFYRMSTSLLEFWISSPHFLKNVLFQQVLLDLSCIIGLFYSMGSSSLMYRYLLAWPIKNQQQSSWISHPPSTHIPVSFLSFPENFLESVIYPWSHPLFQLLQSSLSFQLDRKSVV